MNKIWELLSIFIRSSQPCHMHSDKKGIAIQTKTYFWERWCYGCLLRLPMNYSAAKQQKQYVCLFCKESCSEIILYNGQTADSAFHSKCIKEFSNDVSEELFDVFMSLASVT